MRTLLVFVCFASFAAAQTPTFLHAQVTTRSSSGDLAAQLHTAAQTSAAQWWGYAVPAQWANQDNCGVTYLEGDREQDIVSSDAADADASLTVLYRLENGTVTKLRVSHAGCKLDAGGLGVTWLNGVGAAQSVALQSALARAQPELANSALVAIALTQGDAAEQALEGFTAPATPEKLRQQAVFWLGNERGHAGFLALQKLARTDPDATLRNRLTFALSQSHDPEAVPELIRMAKTDASPNVRGQALFWLAQKAGRQAEAAITEAVANDPDTAVKKRAVFGLSQLPQGEGVPLLIQVAQTNPNPAVRKQAMFWLGQSKDPRALAYFEQLLAKP